MKILQNKCSKAEEVYNVLCPHCGSELELTSDEMDNIDDMTCPCCGDSLIEGCDDIYLKTFTYDTMEKGCGNTQLTDKEIDDLIQHAKDLMIRDKRVHGGLTSSYYYAITGNVGVFIMYDGDDDWDSENVSNGDYWTVYVFKDYDSTEVKDNL